jgi:hypothetical protein
LRTNYVPSRWTLRMKMFIHGTPHEPSSILW